MTITITPERHPNLHIAVTPPALAKVALDLLIAVREGRLPYSLRFPGCGWEKQIDDRAEALGHVLYLSRIALDADAAEQESRRRAGVSPISEHIEIVTDEKGDPIAARKKLRY